MEKRRVVITGLGIVSPIGLNSKEFWRNLLAGKSGVSNLTLFETSTFPVKIAAELDGFDPKAYVEKRKMLKVMVRDMQLAVAASREAVDDAGLDGKHDPGRVGVVFGAEMIAADVNDLAVAIAHSLNDDGAFDIARFGEEGIRQLFPLWLLKQLPNMLASHVSIACNAQGPSNTITTGCSSSAHAVGESFRIIARGDADVMITGGASSRINPMKMLRYELRGVCSHRNDRPEEASRPFDGDADGFVVGEGAGILILEALDRARARDAHIYGEITGYGSSVDTERDAGGRIAPGNKARAVMDAAADGAAALETVDYVQAHGNSIPFADAIETAAIKEVWRERAYSLPVSSIKGQIGDLGAASGAVGAAAALLALQNGVIPHTQNFSAGGPGCDLDYVPGAPRESALRTAVVDSFDFMGHNAALLFRKFGGSS